MPITWMWFATGHPSLLKLFGHFYKMPWYFYQSKTKEEKENRKQKQKENRKGKEPTHLGLVANSAQPKRAPPSSSQDSQAGRSPAGTAWPPGSYLAAPFTLSGVVE